MKHIKTTLLVIAAAATLLTGCDELTKALQGEPTVQLKVAAEYAGFSRWISITNMGEKPVTIQKITVNKKYEVAELTNILSVKPWEPTALDIGENLSAAYPKDCPQAVILDVETDQGNVTYKFE